MKKIGIIFIFLLFISCQNFGQLTFIADLPKDLEEVSGVESARNSSLIWMINDGGNQPKLFGVSKKGNIKREVYIKTKNRDWEDLTSDEKGNIYIGDFGNNLSKRKNLRILKIDKMYLHKKDAEVEKIEFEYENQDKFSSKKKTLYFDAEAFFYFKNYIYIFTKSRVKKEYGKTFLYKFPAKEGNHIAKLIGEYENCNDLKCWITSADISDDGTKVALLSQKNILIFSDFKADNFLGGTVEKIKLEHRTQKEGICFKGNKKLLITDEKSSGEGGNLYELKIN
tara:strand:+ start:1140 stop:1985 length:846 start_codon:yes stop_codon:yes gene_type:complete